QLLLGPRVPLSAANVTLSDSATLSGGSTPTGDIVFTLTGPGGFLFTQTDAVSSGNGTYTAAITLPTAGTVVGTYSWTAHYSGDGNNIPANDQGTPPSKRRLLPLLLPSPPPPRQKAFLPLPLQPP